MDNIDVHLNRTVKVKLTKLGKQILRLSLYEIESHKGGWHELQLWQLMRVFGPWMAPGMPRVFRENIIKIPSI